MAVAVTTYLKDNPLAPDEQSLAKAVSGELINAPYWGRKQLDRVERVVPNERRERFWHGVSEAMKGGL